MGDIPSSELMDSAIPGGVLFMFGISGVMILLLRDRGLSRSTEKQHDKPASGVERKTT